MIAQPDWRNTDDFKKLGKPRLFFGITAGNLDSMVAHYTAIKITGQKTIIHREEGLDFGLIGQLSSTQTVSGKRSAMSQSSSAGSRQV